MRHLWVRLNSFTGCRVSTNVFLSSKVVGRFKLMILRLLRAKIAIRTGAVNERSKALLGHYNIIGRTLLRG